MYKYILIVMLFAASTILATGPSNTAQPTTTATKPTATAPTQKVATVVFIVVGWDLRNLDRSNENPLSILIVKGINNVLATLPDGTQFNIIDQYRTAFPNGPTAINAATRKEAATFLTDSRAKPDPDTEKYSHGYPFSVAMNKAISMKPNTIWYIGGWMPGNTNLATTLEKKQIKTNVVAIITLDHESVSNLWKVANTTGGVCVDVYGRKINKPIPPTTNRTKPRIPPGSRR